MTRINCIPVTELTDKHLVAEYRELPRVFKLARMPRKNEQIPELYTLGTGHVKFFYDKLDYCYKRQHQLYDEMKRRGFKPTFPPERLLLEHHNKVKLWGPWEPTPEAMEINRQRIKERLNG